MAVAVCVCVFVHVCVCCVYVCLGVFIQRGFEGQNKQVYYVTYFSSCICFIKFID